MFEDGVVRYKDYGAVRNFSERKGDIRAIILHSTDSRVDKPTLDWLSGRAPASRVSAHWYISRDGEIYRIVPDELTAWHVGKPIHKTYGNHYTIGIEMGHMDGKEGWPWKQVYACAALCSFYLQKYPNIPMLSHAFVAYPHGRKIDPKDFLWDDFFRFVSELNSIVREVAPDA